MLFSSQLLLRPLPDIFLTTWDLAPLSQHHCMYKRHFADEDLSIPPQNKQNRQKLYVQFAEKVWDSSD